MQSTLLVRCYPFHIIQTFLARMKCFSVTWTEGAVSLSVHTQVIITIPNFHLLLIYTYKRVVCVCLLVCWSAFYRPHDICPLCGAASEWPREREPSSRAAPRARASTCTARARARMPYNFSTKKIAALMPSKNKTVRARKCCRIRNCRDFQKKGKRKPTCHFPSSVYSLPSLGLFTFRIVLNRILHKSSLLPPHGIICNFTFSYLILSKTIGRKRLRT